MQPADFITQNFTFPTVESGNKNLVAAFLREYYNNISAQVYWKDTRGYYQWISKKQAEEANLKCPLEAVGTQLSDYFDGASSAALEAEDVQIIEQGGQKILIEDALYLNGNGIKTISIKQQLKDTHNRILGLIGLSIKISPATNPKARFQKKLMSIGLTIRQSECLYFIMRGFSAREIGEFLQISQRTVESHIDAIKNNTSCDNRVDLIDLALRYYTELH